MTIQEKVDALIEEAAALPEEAQVELVQSLAEMRFQHLGVYYLDDDERSALARSAEDERLGRFASDNNVDHVFAGYCAA